ncbi:MAG: hypothetical protein WC291_12495, partial [Thermodesulfovibrionales bacterium]
SWMLKVVSESLDWSFASKPLRGSFPETILQTFGRHPWLKTGYPFPRFNLVSASRFLYDYSPVGLVDTLRDLPFLVGARGPKSRFFLGQTKQTIEKKFLPEIKLKQKAAEEVLRDARREFKSAESALKAAQRKAEKGGELPGVDLSVQERFDVAKEALKQTRERYAALVLQRRRLLTASRNLTEANVPDAAEFLARQAMGTLGGLGAAWAIRASDGAKDTEWYQYRVGGRTLDLRPFAPFVQYLMVGDLLNDLYKYTDWQGLSKKLQEEGLTSQAAFLTE